MSQPGDRHHDLDLSTRLSRLVSGLGSAAAQVPGFFMDVATGTAQDDYDSLFEMIGARAAARGSEALDAAFSDASGFAALGHGSETAEAIGEGVTEAAGDTASAAGSVGEGLLTGYEWLTGDLRVDPATGERIGWGEESPSGEADRRGLGFQARRLASSAITAPQLAQSQHADFSILDGDTWQLAHDLSGGDFGEDLTIGQSMFHLLAGTDILDPEQVGQWADSPYFDIATGTLDALVRMTTDPDVLLARGAKGLRANYFHPKIKDSIARTSQLDQLLSGKRGRQMDRWMAQLPDDTDEATRIIKNRVFGRDDRGWAKARFLAEAPDRASREATWRILYGDGKAFQELNSLHGQLAQRSELMAELQTLEPLPFHKRIIQPGKQTAIQDRVASIQSQLEKDMVNQSAAFSHLSPARAEDARFDWLNDPGRADLLNAEIRDTLRSTSRIEQLRSLTQSEDEFLKLTVPGALREGIAHSSTYQKSPFTKPVRVTHEKRPHRIIDVEDDSLPEQAHRVLNQAGIPEDDPIRRSVTRMAEELDPEQRVRTWDMMNDTIMRRIISDINAKHGTNLAGSQVDEILAEARRGSQRARDHVKRQYSAGNRDRFPVEADDGTHMVRMPMFRSQSPNTVFAPDFTQIRKTLDRQARKGFLPHPGETVEAGADVLDSVNFFWKAHVLLRGAWPIRVTGFDEAWRPLIKYGASSALPEVAKGARNYARAVSKDLGFDNPTRAGRTGAVTGGLLGTMMGGIPGVTAGFDAEGVGGAALGGALGATAGSVGFRMLSNLARTERAGINWSRLNKLNIAPPFGEPGDVANLFYDRASSRRSLTRFLREDREFDQLSDEISRNPRAWETVRPGDARHMEDWETHINSVVRGDDLAERILRGDSHEDLVSWLDTHEGRRYIRGFRAHEEVQNPDLLIQRATAEVNALFPGAQGDQLREVALSRPVAQSDLSSLYPDQSSRPNVLGEGLREPLQGNLFTRKLYSGIDNWMRRLGQMPTDNLVRHPTFEVAYRRYFERWLDSNHPQWRDGKGALHLPPDELSTLQDSARRQALTEVRDISYDLAERSELHHLLRHVHPFLPAVQEAISTHLGMAAKNPTPYTRAAKAWFGADRIDNISYRDPEDGSQWLVFPVPESASNITKHFPTLSNAVDTTGNVRVPKSGFNMILQAPFGVGPFVQGSVSEILKRKPGLEGDIKPLMDIFMPYGPSSSFHEAWLGTYARRGKALAESWLNGPESNREYHSYYMRNLGMALADIEEGRREPVDWDSPEEVRQLETDITEKTNSVFTLRMVSGFLSPVQPVYESPFWMHEQALRQEMEREQAMDPADRAALHQEHGTAVERFMDAYGDEMAYLLHSFSESHNGVPPDQESFAEYTDHADLISQYPEYGGFIVGRGTDSQQVEFSRSVFDYQLREPVEPGSDETQRELVSPRGLSESGQETIAWKEYTRLMDWIEAERVSRGLPNLQVAEARDLAALKERRQDQLATQYPAWGKSREEEIDLPRAKWEERLEFFRSATNKEALKGRPDVQAVSQYLDLRDQMVLRLAQRDAQGGARTINSESNRDLAQIWDTALSQLLESNVNFGPVYYRWFEHDVPSAADLELVPGAPRRPEPLDELDVPSTPGGNQ